ncbi:HPr family phosphocarrier protein [Bacillus salipaludis]|uniref:HPr family phosphocarrier protein n=1 Tax=Bacillus salipaludis TaxID=2547811 RepID=A0AA90TX14_9BACI|nr:HPr family phosphocarrier protein [Bacillus salipaludis]MDQ6601048.1 HPr family phosphocarrier protein [Bacillus salipaludis]
MVEKEIVCQLSNGLQARVATEFITKANLFKSEVSLIKEKRTKNCKSIIGVMGLALRKGDVVKLNARGTDEKHAYENLRKTEKSGDFAFFIEGV